MTAVMETPSKTMHRDEYDIYASEIGTTQRLLNGIPDQLAIERKPSVDTREATSPASSYQAANCSMMPNREQCAKAVQFHYCPMFNRKQLC